MVSKLVTVIAKKVGGCYKKYPNEEARCRALGDKIRDDYHHPWRSKK